MGWGNCGTDSQGRPIGYYHAATCDYPGCDKKIDRGLDYVCGDMHGADEYSCERYFCEEHHNRTVVTRDDRHLAVCDECYAECLARGYDPNEDAWP